MEIFIAIENIYLTGIGADFVGMDELLSNELGYNVKKYTGLDNIRIGSSNFNALESMRVYAAAIGASYEPLQLLSADLMKGEKQTSLALPIAVFVACVATAITLFFVGKISVDGAKSKNEQLKVEIKENEVLESINNTYKEARETFARIDSRLDMYSDNNRLLTQFINEMEQKMPSGFKSVSFSADAASGVAMTVRCHSKEEAAKVFQALRKFETIVQVSASEFTETYEFTKEYLDFVQNKYKTNIDKEIKDEDLLLEGETIKQLSTEELEARREAKREEIAKKYARTIEYGRLMPLEEGQEADPEFPEDQIMEKTVLFSINCIYNPACTTNAEYMKTIKAALDKEQQERDEIEKARIEAEKEAERLKEEAEKAKQEAGNGGNN